MHTCVCASGGEKYVFLEKFCVRTRWMIPKIIASAIMVGPLYIIHVYFITSVLAVNYFFKKTPS